MTTIASLVVEIGASIDGLTRGLNQAEKKTDSFIGGMGSSLQGIRRNLTGLGAKFTLMAAPVAAGFGTGIKVASDFEGVMAEISARAGLTGADLQRVSDFALQMGADTAFSGQEAAEAFLQLLTSGQTVEQAIATLPSVLDAAAASGEDLGMTADTITDIMASFGLGVEQSAAVVDSLARAAGASSADMGGLGQGFANVGGVARAFGLKVDRTAAILAVLAENGIKGAEGGTALKSMLLNMTRPTDEVRGAWDALGASFYDADGNARDMTDILADIKIGLQDMPVEEQNELLYKLGGSYGIVALQALLGANSIEEMEAAMAGSTGASDVAAARMDTYAGSVDALKGSVETLMITALTPYMEDVLKPMQQRLTEIVNSVTDWAKENPGLTSTIVSLIAKTAMVGPALVALGIGISAVSSAWTALSTGVLASIATAAAPILLVGLAIAGAAILIANNAGKIKDAIAEIGTAILTGDWSRITTDVHSRLEDAVNGVQNFDFEFLKGKVTLGLNRIIYGANNDQWAKDLARTLHDAINNPANIGDFSLDGLRDSIRDKTFQMLLDPNISPSVREFGQTLIRSLNALDLSNETLGEFAGRVKTKIETSINSIGFDTTVFSQLAERIQSAISDTLANVFSGGGSEPIITRDMIERGMGGADSGGIGSTIASQLTAAMTSVQGVSVDTSGITTWATTNMNSIVNAVAAVAVAVIGGPVGLTIGAAKLISTAIETDFLGIGTFLKDSGIKASVETAFNTLKTDIGGILERVFNPSQPVITRDMIERGVGGAQGGGAVGGPLGLLISDLQKGADWFSQELPKITGPILEGLSALGEGIGGFIQNLSGTETEGLLRIATTVAGAIGAIVTKLVELGAGLVGDVLTNIGEALPAIGAFINDFVSALSRLGEGDWAGAAQRLGEGLMSFVEAGLALIGLDFSTIIATISGLWDSVSAGVETFKTNIAAAFGWIKINVIDPIKAAIDGIKSSLDGLTGGLGAYGGAADNLGAALNSGASPGDILGAFFKAVGDEINPPGALGGASIVSTGLVLAHAGERILNPMETRAYESGNNASGGNVIHINGVQDVDGILAELRRRGIYLESA